MTEIANLVIWEKIFERHRRIVLSAVVTEICSRIQREGDVVHLVASRRRLLKFKRDGRDHSPGLFAEETMEHDEGDRHALSRAAMVTAIAATASVWASG